MEDCHFQLVETLVMVGLMPVEVTLTGLLLRWEGTSIGAEKVAVEAPVQWRSLRRKVVYTQYMIEPLAVRSCAGTAWARQRCAACKRLIGPGATTEQS